MFVLNFAADFIYLCSALYICKLKRRVLPIIGASALGGIYSVLWIYMTDIYYILQIIIHICVMILICSIAVPSNNSKTVLKTSSVFFVVNAFGGGIISSVFSMAGKYFLFGGGIYADITAFEFLLLIFVLIIISIPLFVKTKNKLSVKTASVFISGYGKSSSFDALIDSGNLLSDPISGDGIMLVKQFVLKEVFASKELNAIKELNVLSENFPTGIRLVSSSRGLIPVFRPTKTEIKLLGDKSKKEVSILIGIDFTSGTFGGAFGLIPAQYIE